MTLGRAQEQFLLTPESGTGTVPPFRSNLGGTVPPFKSNLGGTVPLLMRNCSLGKNIDPPDTPSGLCFIYVEGEGGHEVWFLKLGVPLEFVFGF